jgi:hypothetical protein
MDSGTDKAVLVAVAALIAWRILAEDTRGRGRLAAILAGQILIKPAGAYHVGIDLWTTRRPAGRRACLTCGGADREHRRQILRRARADGVAMLLVPLPGGLRDLPRLPLMANRDFLLAALLPLLPRRPGRGQSKKSKVSAEDETT